jgi:hypothetical protein
MKTGTALGSLIASLVIAGGLFAGIGATAQAHAAASFTPVHSNPMVRHGIERIVPDPTCPTCLRGPFSGIAAALRHVHLDAGIHARIVSDSGSAVITRGAFGRMGGSPPVVVD